VQSSLQHVNRRTGNCLAVSVATYSVQAHGLWREPVAADANAKRSCLEHEERGTWTPEILVEDLQIPRPSISDQ